jgi:hypothetical protein
MEKCPHSFWSRRHGPTVWLDGQLQAQRCCSTGVLYELLASERYRRASAYRGPRHTGKHRYARATHGDGEAHRVVEEIRERLPDAMIRMIQRMILEAIAGDKEHVRHSDAMLVAELAYVSSKRLAIEAN